MSGYEPADPNVRAAVWAQAAVNPARPGTRDEAARP
jgi:hypothetical protein